MAKHDILSGILSPNPHINTAEPLDGEVKESKSTSTLKKGVKKTSLYVSDAVHDKLREIAFVQRKSINDLVVEGLDLMLKEYRYPTTAEITKAAKDA